MTEDTHAASSDEPVVADALRVPAGSALTPERRSRRGLYALFALSALLGVLSLALAWRADLRGSSLEQELVRRQQDSTLAVNEARMLAKQAQETTGQTAAKVALLEARLAEVAVQRSQLEDLMQSLSRSRDENLLVDVEAGIRVALQQSAITGSAEPLVATLKQSDERLARYNQPRLEGVRRAIARDLDRVKAASVVDISSLAIKLDEATRMVDELPLVAVAEPGKASSAVKGSAAQVRAPAASAVTDAWDAMTSRVWSEIKSLFRVTRIDFPEAMLLAPDQTIFIRENLKLRLLNARLALLSRQFETAQSDLQLAQGVLERYFERGAKRTQLALELVRQVVAQARQVIVPRPDDTLAALATATAGR